MLSSVGKKSSETSWNEWGNSRSLFNCSLVRVLIISSTKWETLKTDKSATNYLLCLVSRSWTYWLSLLSAFSLESLNFSSPFFCPVVKMNMVVSSQLSSITELNLTLLTAQRTGRRQVILSLLCSCGSNVTKSLAKAGPLFQLRVEATDLAMYCSFS